jgi:hypothetical protein
VTAPTAVPPHQDPSINPHTDRVTIMEYVTTLISTLDRRFDTLHQDLKDSIGDRFTATHALVASNDLRYQSRFEDQTKALDAALAAAKEAVQTALVAAEKATSKAEAAADKRFDSVNEFRSQLADQAATFIPRAEAEARLTSLAELVEAKYAGLLDKLTDLIAHDNRAQGRTAGIGAGWNYLIGFVGLVVAAATVIGIVVGTR